MNLGTRLITPVNSARDSQVNKSKATNKQTVQQGRRVHVQSAMFKAKILVVGPCEVSEEQE